MNCGLRNNSSPSKPGKLADTFYPIVHPAIRTRRGAILLEALLSMTLFAMGMLVVSAAVSRALDAGDAMSKRSRATGLAQSVLAELRAQIRPMADRIEGDFAPHFPDYRFQVVSSELPDMPNLRSVTVTVGWARDPDAPETDIDPARAVDLTAWVYLPPPPENADAPTEQGATEATP